MPLGAGAALADDNAPDGPSSPYFTNQVPTEVGTAPKITTGALPWAWVTDQLGDDLPATYNESLLAIGTGPIEWSIVPGSGDLPSGFVLSSAGVISGETWSTGVFTFSVMATNDFGSDTLELSIEIGTLIVCPTELASVIYWAEELDLSAYSVESAAAVTAALQAAYDYERNGPFTVEREAAIIDALYTAIAALFVDSRIIEFAVLEHFGSFTGSGAISARVDANPDNFLHLVDNTTDLKVDAANYTISTGSTVITFSEDHLKTYSDGSYWFTAVFSNGVSARLKLDIVRAPAVEPESTTDITPATDTVERSLPDTGGSFGVPSVAIGLAILSIALLAVGIVALSGTATLRRRDVEAAE